MWRKSVQLQILEMLGEGTQGRVFKALRRDRASGLSQTVALKVLHSKNTVELWKREFESLARVDSPFCVRVLAFERLKGQPALVLEYVDGVSLLEISRTCLLSANNIAEIRAQIYKGLLDLQAHGLSHGDLSPQNVLIDRNGRIRLLDFGLANGGSGRAARFTHEFAAPERLCGEEATLDSDLFSLGRLIQFLRAEPLAGDPKGCHLGLEGISPSSDHQKELAGSVQLYLQRRDREKSMMTRTQTSAPIKRRRHHLARCAPLFCLALLAASSRATQSSRIDLALIHLRTRVWHYFVVDGAPIGYSPVSIELKAGETHVIQWTSADGQGQKQIRLSAHETRTLVDRDFSH